MPANRIAKPEIRAFFDEPTNTVSYLVWDAATKQGAVIDPVLDYDFRSGKATFASADAILAEAKKLGVTHRAGAGNARACRSSLRRALYQAQDRRQDLHRRAHPRRAAHLPPGVQRHRRVGRGLRVRPPVQGRRALQDRRARRRGDLHARPHAGLHLLQDRRRGLCRRHHVHARLRHRARRFPRRRRARALPFDPAHPVAAGGDAAVHVPRLQGAGPRSIRLGDHGRRGARPQRARPRGRQRGRVRRRCGSRATQRSPRRCCCCPRSRSTSAPASFRRPRPTACTISRCR